MNRQKYLQANSTNWSTGKWCSSDHCSTDSLSVFQSAVGRVLTDHLGDCLYLVRNMKSWATPSELHISSAIEFSLVGFIEIFEARTPVIFSVIPVIDSICVYLPADARPVLRDPAKGNLYRTYTV